MKRLVRRSGSARLAVCSLMLTLGLVVVACGGDDDKDADPATGQESGGETDAAKDAPAPPASYEDAAVQAPAEDIKFPVDSYTVAPGDITIGLKQAGSMEHSLVIEGHESDLRLVVKSPGEIDLGAINLPEGAYVFYCDIPGHRGLGMEGDLFVLDPAKQQ